MSANSRFAVATQILTNLALAHAASAESVLTSTELAKCINTSPVVVRRIVGMLHVGGLVRALLGRNGGVYLARSASSISLLDVYRSVDEPGLFAHNPNEPNPGCPVSVRMTALLNPVFSEAERAVAARLGKIRLSTLVSAVRADLSAQQT